MRIVSFLIIGLMVTACTPALSPAQNSADLNRRFAGRTAQEFFSIYGLPAGGFDLNGNENIYRWTSASPSVVTSHRYYSKDGMYEAADNYNHFTQAHYCEVRVVTDKADIIEKFDVAVDSMGKWSSSRCSEIFAAPSI